MPSGKHRFYLAVLLIVGYIAAETHISGDMNRITFSKEGNPFIVDKDILVPNGQQVTIPAGCIFLFTPFSGVIVNGTLRVLGSENDPVVFSTINNGKYNPKAEQMPNPFDWNGLHILSSASKVLFENFTLSYSTYGIQSETSEISVVNGNFQHNGQYHFTIKNESSPRIVPVQDNIAFTCKDGEECLYLASGTISGAAGTVGGVSGRRSGNIRIPLSIGLSLAGIGAGVAGVMQSQKAMDAYDKAGEPYLDGALNDRYYDKYKKYYIQSAAAFAGSGLCLCAATYFYFFHFKDTTKKQVSFFPYVAPDGIYGLTMNARW